MAALSYAKKGLPEWLRQGARELIGSRTHRLANSSAHHRSSWIEIERMVESKGASEVQGEGEGGSEGYAGTGEEAKGPEAWTYIRIRFAAVHDALETPCTDTADTDAQTRTRTSARMLELAQQWVPSELLGNKPKVDGK